MPELIYIPVIERFTKVYRDLLAFVILEEANSKQRAGVPTGGVTLLRSYNKLPMGLSSFGVSYSVLAQGSKHG